ncbi:6-pyruvoyl trahydropterin synthase family protein [Falsiporphyromonas endometrii]|uniref:6-carboxy-5,6,7,8-tetrahydropterin synthase n=1 Tax=Falsiporphyromonas endometrii TaxID=1387297 RepID=A0ABV9K7C0_9PORP
MIAAERYHDISMGHRVVGHQHKCRHLHGHNYRVHFRCTAEEQNELGMVIDFGVIKDTLCRYLEEYWDHKMMIWQEDPLLEHLEKLVPEDIIIVPFNPTAENMARYLVEVIGPRLLTGTGVTLSYCRVDETRKCSAIYSL